MVNSILLYLICTLTIFSEIKLHVGSNVVKTLVNGLINANFEIIIFLPIESEMMEIFLHSRYLNNYFYLPDMIGLFANGTTTSLVAKN